MAAAECSRGFPFCKTPWAHQDHLFFLFVYPCLSPDLLDPFLGLLFGVGVDMEVTGRRKETEDMLSLALRIFLPRNGGEIGQGDLVS
jgi:hypothetical protein